MSRRCIDCRATIRETTQSPRCACCRRSWRLRRDREYRLRQNDLRRAARVDSVSPGTCLLCRVPCEGAECADALGCARRASERLIAASEGAG